jgi:hypothetical protein
MSRDSVHSAKNGRTYDLYEWFFNHVTTALQKIGRYHIEGMFWMQGEADAGCGPSIARSCKHNLVEFVTTRIRNDFSQVPFVYGKIQNWYGTVPWPHGAIVLEQQQRAEAAIGNARFVPACGDRNATVYLDSTGRYPCAMQGSMDCYPALGCYFYHYDTRGQVYIGRALGRAMAELKRE